MARRWTLAYRDDVKQLRRAFKVLGESRFQEAFEAIGREYVRLAQQSFDQSKDPYSRRWKPLAESTLRQRGSGAKPLVDTGTLRNSLRHRATNEGVELYSAVDYAKYHQGDPSIGASRVIPRRPFLPTERGLPKRWETAARQALLSLLED